MAKGRAGYKVRTFTCDGCEGLYCSLVNRCKFAALTFGNVRAAREYEQRTGRHASACTICGKWHA